MTVSRRSVVACLAAAAVLVPLGWMWWSSLLPDEYSVMDMGHADYGGGSTEDVALAGHGHTGGQAAGVNIATLTTGPGPADVKVELVAREETFELPSGRQVDGYTLNGSSPGPLIRAEQGDMVEVTLVNEDVDEGITLHWHGIDVPNAMDGVAGVTQDAVLEGGRHTYRFVADQVGTYWYHSHQLSHEQVKGGLLGAIVISPVDADPELVDVPALLHQYAGRKTVNGLDGNLAVDAAPGATVRVRLINTDNGPMLAWVGGAPFRVVAVDGVDVHQPTEVTDQAVQVTAGGRADLEIVMPADGSGVRVELAGSNAVLLGDSGSLPETTKPDTSVDMLRYGQPADLGFDPTGADRNFEYVVGRRPGFLDGRPGLWWTVNGKQYPDVPMYTVSQGDIVRMRIENDSGEVHPMHLHGHHAVVLSRDGKAATGSPWWVDSLNVEDGETYEIAFVADNPGVWMDHCHNLPHAAEGLVAHLMYTGVHTPFMIGGKSQNEPE